MSPTFGASARESGPANGYRASKFLARMLTLDEPVALLREEHGIHRAGVRPISANLRDGPAQRIRLLGRQRLDDVQTGHGRDHLIETEPSLTQQLAVFLPGAFLPSGHEHHDYIHELAG